MASLPKEQVTGLKMFVALCKQNPGILHTPELQFYRDYLESLGAKIPPAPTSPKAENPKAEEPKTEEMKDEQQSPPQDDKPAPVISESSDEEPESDLELDLDFVIKPETDPLPTLPSTDKLPSEDDQDKANDKRREAMTAMSDGNTDGALAAFGEAIELNPQMAALYAKRAQLFVRLKRPNAAIQDCNRALELNADSALAFKQRGRAHRLLGKIVDAYKDLGKGQQIDYDDDTAELMNNLKDNVHKVQEHDNKMANKNKEKEIKRKKKEAARRKAEAQKEYEKQQQSGMPGGFPGGMPGGFPGGMPGGFPGGMPGGFPGGMPGGFPGGMPGGAGAAGGMGGMFGLDQILKDPELLECFSDPEVSAAFAEVSQNPEAMNKYKDNPKVKAVLDKLMKKFKGPADTSGARTSSSTADSGSSSASASASSTSGTASSSAQATAGAPSGPSPSSMDLD